MRVVLLFFFAISCAYPQISGRVIDPSGSAVPDARVAIVHRSSASNVIAITDGNGAYSFAGLPAGEWLIEARASGFGSSKAAAIELRSGERQSVDLTLELQRVSTQVQVTAAGGAQTVDEQAKALTVIDAQQLTDRAEYSIAEGIRDVPGIRVQQLGGPEVWSASWYEGCGPWTRPS